MGKLGGVDLGAELSGALGAPLSGGDENPDVTPEVELTQDDGATLIVNDVGDQIIQG